MVSNLSEPSSHDVVVTGLGAYTAAGPGKAELWASVMNGVSLARWHQPNESKSEARYAVCRAADVEITDPELTRFHKMDRSVLFAGVAALEAWRDAGLSFTPSFPERLAVFAGTSRGPLEVVLESKAALDAGPRVRPTFAPNSTIACLSGALSNLIQAGGSCLTVSAACASSAGAIALGAQQIVSGAADVALVGGAEAPLNALILAQLKSAGVFATSDDPQLACRPFDATRNGTVLGEGAAFLVLESLAHARQRGAAIYARLAGWAVTSERSQRTGISGDTEGLRRTMLNAVRMAGLSFDDLDYVNAHGTGTALNDRLESQAIGQCCEENTRLRTSSTKAVTGHCMGAASAIEAVISILALEKQCLPPSTNCFNQASDCSLRLVNGAPPETAINAVLTNSLGFWGNNASLVFTKAPTR